MIAIRKNTIPSNLHHSNTKIITNTKRDSVERGENMYELYHHGIKGQKWGVRRYQNPDGTLTAAGRRKYNKIDTEQSRDVEVINNSRNKLINSKKYSESDQYRINRIADKRIHDTNVYNEFKKASITNKGIKKTDDYKRINKHMTNLNLRRGTDLKIGEAKSIENDLKIMKKNEKKVNTLLEKYTNTRYNYGSDSKKAERAAKKLEKAANKCNKISMELANGQITSVGHDDKTGNYTDWEFYRYHSVDKTNK